MFRENILFVRWIMITAVPILCLLLLLIFRKKRKAQIVTLITTATIFFFMFFFGIYVRVPNINKVTAEKIWDTLSALDFGEPQPDSESDEIKSYSKYKEERDNYSISVEKWISDEELDLNLWYSVGTYPSNGMRLIYKLLMTGRKGKEYAWKISPLSAARVDHEFYAFTGWYNGSFIIKKLIYPLSISYPTSQGNLSAFMCIRDRF